MFADATAAWGCSPQCCAKDGVAAEGPGAGPRWAQVPVCKWGAILLRAHGWCQWWLRTIASMTFRGRSQDTNKGHIGRPVLPMSPGSGGGSTTSIKWEELRDCTWPLVSRFRYQWGRMHLFLQLLWGAQGLDTAELCQPWDKETMAADKVALLSHTLWAFLQPTTGHLRSHRTECVF